MCFDNRPIVAGITFNILLILLLYGLFFFLFFFSLFGQTAWKMWTAHACGCQYFSTSFSGVYVACILLACQVRVTVAVDEEDSGIEQGFEMGSPST